MACGVTDLGGCIKEGAESAVEALANATADACAWAIKQAFTWWVDTDPDGLNTAVSDSIRDVTQPLALGVAVSGIIIMAIQMVISGKPDPLIPLGAGLGKFLLWTTTGTLLITNAMKMGAGFSGWVLDDAAGRDVGAAFGKAIAFDLLDGTPGAVFVLALFGFVAGIAQWLIGFLREGAVVILAGCLSLAASGSMAPFGRKWLPKVLGWTLAFVCWQPAASLVYRAAFEFIGEADDSGDTLIGLAMLIMAVACLPVLMKLFNWAADSVMDSGGGTLSGVASTAGAGLRMAANSGGGQPHSASRQAELISRSLPAQGEGGHGSGSGPRGARTAAAQKPDTAAPGKPSTAQKPVGGTPAPAGAPAAAGSTAAPAAAKATTTATTKAASAAAGPAGAVVQVAQAAHGAAQTAANKMTNPPTRNE
ncbi:hypothetical protein GA0115255_127283 [Streptomyces sp. Ncost-T6T-2b]|nr:hypothetical protein GA0115255_127283 [Streptomyces sp. Ncost-T6T-2b]